MNNREGINLRHAKALRQNMTEAEQKLWYFLRGKRFMGIKFKRQKPIGPYIVDFVAVNHKVIVELDGSQHQDQQNYDAQRTADLESLGFTVLRFWNDAVFTQTNALLDRIAEALGIADRPSSTTGSDG